ncbi:MAG TPA: ABC transporter substrate-binding protein [Polyangiaceae bacterium]|jgi:branched-chain amino acid transport system substrate-binding protein|nr:ABC transporter substrate-binding protein [Polyangiaceae bacterium]
MRGRWVAFFAASGIALAASCSPNFTAKTCATDSDCGSLVCEMNAGQPACIAPQSAALHVGMSAPISGPNQELGTDMKLGVTLAFNAQNAAGGIRGRQLVLDFRDDQYEPDLAEQAARSLVNVQATQRPPRCPTTNDPTVSGTPGVSTTALDRGQDAVIAFLGNVGTPTMVRAAPVSLETGTIFFGAFTGANTILRDTSAGACAKYVFNVRASYADEARATLEYFFLEKVPDYQHLISFDQNDSFGQAGYSGLVAAYTAIKGSFPATADATNPIARFRYTRNDTTSVPAQVEGAALYLTQLLSADSAPHTVGIMMTDTYGAAVDFITGLRQWQFAADAQQTTLQKASRLTLLFSNVSFVGPNALAQGLKSAGTVQGPSGPVPYTQDVVVSQVVPNYQSDTSDVVSAYRGLVTSAQKTPGFTSLEGYVDARIFIAALTAHQGPFTPESLVQTIENLPDLSLGLGAASGFSPTNHSYSKSVWGTAIGADGSFQDIYFWSDGTPIQLFE